MSLSVIVITKDEEAVIRRCLESVAWADEIVVVDSGSRDRTLEICRGLNAKVALRDWPGPGAQRNRALDLASGDWVLALDADEWVPAELRAEIERSVAAAGAPVAYDIPRLSSYCGRYMKHGGWWPDYVLRLFRRGYGRFDESRVHEHLVPNGPVGRLRAHLMHEPFVNLEQVLAKLDRYSTWGAQGLEEGGKRAGLGTAVAHGLWTFLRTYILRLGFLDGREGFMLAVSNAEGTYYKYAKLWLRRRTARSPR